MPRTPETSKPPRVVVFSTLFPNSSQPNAGLFIRERMFRVARHLPLTVVAPVPWFPFQGVVRLFRPHFRPPAPRQELQQGIVVRHPRFLSLPGLAKSLDGIFLALSCLNTLRRIQREEGVDILDAHFAYPDGYAATLLGRWLGVPVTITLRGTEARLVKTALREHVKRALERAALVFSVSDSLRRVAIALGIDEHKTLVVGNGVDVDKFTPVDRSRARAKLGLDLEAPVLVSVGGLTERKGFHRVIEILPALRREFPDLVYLVIGGASAEGDWGPKLKEMTAALGLGDCVRFLGALPQTDLIDPLSAADVFVLATRNEGWANVFLEAMACGLPVVTTDVGGNAEVVCRPEIGTVIPFGDAAALEAALREALRRPWDRAEIIAHARANAWDDRVCTIADKFNGICEKRDDAGSNDFMSWRRN